MILGRPMRCAATSPAPKYPKPRLRPPPIKPNWEQDHGEPLKCIACYGRPGRWIVACDRAGRSAALENLAGATGHLDYRHDPTGNGQYARAGRLTQLSLFAVPALAMSLIFKDVDLKGLHYR